MCCRKSLCAANARRTLTWLLTALVLVLAVRNWVCMPALVVGHSMDPTLHSGKLVMVNKLAFLLRNPARGDIVCIRMNRGYMIKRIIGLPGEEVALNPHGLFVNGRLTPEPYLQNPKVLEVAPGTIPADAFGVVGDNRSDTVVAVVSKSRIVGKLTFGPHLAPGAPLPPARAGLAL